jgi:hypothetical protein
MKKLLVGSLVVASMFGGAGAALAGHGGGLGPRPDGETGSRCAAALDHAAAAGSEQGQESKAGGMAKAMENCAP